MCEEEAKSEDVLAYTQRNEFTSEIFKIEVRNLGIFGVWELKKLIKNTLNLDASKIKSPNKRDFAFVCFRNQEEQEKAISVLNGYKWKGKVLAAMTAKASADPLIKRRNEGNQRQDDQPKRQKTSIEATCPLAGLPYKDQIEQKRSEMENLLKTFGKELIKLNPDVKKSCFSPGSDLPCEFLGIKESPVIDGYRNKSEFTVGKNSEGEIVVGFRLGSYADGSVEVCTVADLPQVSELAKKAALTFQEYVRQSKFLPFNPEHNAGHFRQVTVRTSDETKEVMLVAGVYSSNLTAEEIPQLKQELIDFYANYDKAVFSCSSLYYQDLRRRQTGETFSPVEHLAGTTHITDVILGLRFRISPLAFFQINSKGAEVLYREAIDLIAPKEQTTVLDICCGTGTIALSFAKHCKKVLGVEIIEDAIKDAEFNAKENAIENCKFYAGNADDYIQSMVREVVYGAGNHKDQLDLVAIVDPPRAGLHNKSIAAIRSAYDLKRLVYISCNPKSAQRNWLDLARTESKQYKGSPFYPIKAVAVDMFPHTAHTEMAILFERKVEQEIAEAKIENETKTKSEAETKNEAEVKENSELKEG